MNIAAVIVDVPAKQTDREFDYRIPRKWKADYSTWYACHCSFWPKNGARICYAV